MGNIITIATILISLAIGIVLGMIIRKKIAESKIQGAEEEAKRLATTNMYILNDKLGKKHKIFDVKRM